MEIDLKKHDMIVIMDLGQLKVTIFYPLTNSFEVLKAQEMFEKTIEFPENTLIIGENAHFGTPRQDDFEKGKVSKAQYYFPKQLLEWYNELAIRGITLKLFPQKLTERSRRLNKDELKEAAEALTKQAEQNKDGKGSKKTKGSDLMDCLAIWIHLNDFPRTTLKNPPKTFAEDPVRTEGLKMRDGMTRDKNVMRFFDYSHEKDYVSKWVRDNIYDLQSNLPEEVRETFGLSGEKLLKKDGSSHHTDVKMSQITAVLLSMMSLNGNPRMRKGVDEDGEKIEWIAGWQFVKKYLFVMGPNHERGGVCRSDLYWHGLRNYIAGEGGIEKVYNKKGNLVIKPMTEFDAKHWATFQILREQYCKHVRVLFQTMKRMLLGKSSGDSVTHSVNSEFSSKSQQTLFSEK